MKLPFLIGERELGAGRPAYIVAEISANHNGSLDNALEIVRAAKAAGADGVKIQTYTPDTMTIASELPPFQVGPGTIWEGRNLHDLYCEAQTPWAWHGSLRDEALSLGLDFFSTAFDATAVDFLEELGVPIHKIASFELVDIPLIKKMAGTGKPLIMSTGMASLAEIEEAVMAAREAGAAAVMLLKCTSAYPARPEDMNLRTIQHLAQAFAVPVGLSDHTPGATVAATAVALGACLVEKHLTLSRNEPGPDSDFSLEPHEFEKMVAAVRTAESALGQINYQVTPREAAGRVFRRSLFVVEDVVAGEIFSSYNVRSIRPAHGLAPKHLPRILGARATRSISCGTPLTWSMVDQAEWVAS